MKQENKNILSEERKLRNISDYIFDCINRLSEQAEFFIYLESHKNNFINKESNDILRIIPSIIDVYSRDCVIILGNILDENRLTSSLFSLTHSLSDEKSKNKHLAKLKSIKQAANPIVRARGNAVAHFNTSLNTIENGYIHTNNIIQIDPQYLKKITKKIKIFYWKIREDLNIKGTFIVHRGESLKSSFKLLTSIKTK